MEQRFFRCLQRGELALAEGFEAFGIDRQPIESGNDNLLFLSQLRIWDDEFAELGCIDSALRASDVSFCKLLFRNVGGHDWTAALTASTTTPQSW